MALGTNEIKEILDFHNYHLPPLVVIIKNTEAERWFIMKRFAALDSFFIEILLLVIKLLARKLWSFQAVISSNLSSDHRLRCVY